MYLAKTIHDIFLNEFGSTPSIFSAPGRVNIIGEHTDYNGGFVLPSAIDKAAYLAIGPSSNGKGKWVSVDFNDHVEIDFSHFARQKKNWPNYLLGVLDQFNRSGKTPSAFNLVLAADIPVGAGLSSSAAIESAMAVAINNLNGYGFDKLTLALMAQQAEHEYIGLKCGIMDMYASMYGKKGYVMKIDCRSLTHEYFPLGLGDYRIVLLDTGIRHDLASSEYNIRRQQCEDGVQLLQKYYPDVKQLRDVSSDMLENYKDKIPPLLYKRCYYIVEENKRVEQVCTLLKAGSLDQVGQLLYESHNGLQYDYDVSCRELDLLIKLVKNETHVLGARMMGGGFGGCTLNIIHKDAIEPIISKISSVYVENTGRPLHYHQVITGEGAREIKV